MERKRFFGLGVLAFTFILGLVQVPQAFAQVNFQTSTERDEWMQEALRKYPFYVILTDMAGADELVTIEAAKYALAKAAGEHYGPPTIDDVAYQGNDTGTFARIVIMAYGAREPSALFVLFAKDRASADTVAQNLKAQQGGTIWGPFTHGSSARNARDSHKRIIDGLTSFKQYLNDKNPWS